MIYVVAQQHPTLPEVSMFTTASKADADQYRAIGWTVLEIEAPPDLRAELATQVAELAKLRKERDEWHDAAFLAGNQDSAYKRMFEEAVLALAAIDKALGVEPDGCNDPCTTVSAVKDVMANLPHRAAPLQPALTDTLLYLAFAGHATPQHMLPAGVTLFDNDGVLVKLPDGRVVTAGRVPDYAVKYAKRFNIGGAG